jgi:hypothetical protein
MHLLTEIRRHELDGRLHFGDYALRFIDAFHTALTEPFLLGNLADCVNLLVDVTRNQLAVSPYTSV